MQKNNHHKRYCERSLGKREYIIINPQVSRVILFVPFRAGRQERKNGPGLSDNSADLSPFTTLLQRSAAIIASQFVPGEKRRKKKARAGGRVCIGIHIHVSIHTPAAIGTALMHARLPRNADARVHDLFVLASVVRSACEKKRIYVYSIRNPSLSLLHASIYVSLAYIERVDIHKCHSGAARDSDRLTLCFLFSMTLINRSIVEDYLNRQNHLRIL